MNHFMPSFLLCNLLISGIIGALLVGKRLLRNSLSSRMQYNLWFLLLGLLAVPFLPVQKINLALQKAPAVPAEPAASVTAALQPANAAVWINELGVTVSSKTPSGIGSCCGFYGCLASRAWLSGLCGLSFLFTESDSLHSRCKILRFTGCIVTVWRKCTSRNISPSTALHS